MNSREFAKEFADHVAQLLEVVWDQEADGEAQWSVLRDCTVKICNDFLERGRRKQPNWFTAAESFLHPMIAKRNVLFSHWLLSGRGVDRQKYLSQRRSVASAVGSSKNKWLQEKTKSIQDALAQGRPNGCGRIFELFKSIGLVYSLSNVVLLRRRMESCALDLSRL